LIKLLELQDLDMRIERLQSREIDIPKQKNRFAIQRKRLAEELALSEEKLKRLQAEQRECEGDIELKQQQIGKYKGQLVAVRKNEEYSALLHEIELCKKQISAKEERILQIMEESDAAREHLEEDKKRIAAELAEIDRECAEIDEEFATAVKEREALQGQRGPLITEADSGMLAQYRRIRKKISSGAAVVPISPTGESCTGCHMAVRAQIANEVLAGKVHACAHCGRLLYHAENFGAKAMDSGEPA
jgi:predicted  nucleic acid-binding Zn-ribbon protein